jgi:hypothetical protein
MKTLYQAFDHDTKKHRNLKRDSHSNFARSWTSCFFTPRLYGGMHSIENLKDAILSFKGSHRTKSCRN